MGRWRLRVIGKKAALRLHATLILKSISNLKSINLDDCLPVPRLPWQTRSSSSGQLFGSGRQGSEYDVSTVGQTPVRARECVSV